MPSFCNLVSVAKLSSAFQVGESFLDVRVTRGIRGKSCTFSREGTPIKLTLEKIDQDGFSRALLHYFYFRTPEQKYTATRKFFAKIGFHNKEPLKMEYTDQKYKFKFPAEIEGRTREIQMFYSPVVGRMVVRAMN